MSKIATMILGLTVWSSALYAEIVQVTEHTKITKPYTQRVMVSERIFYDTIEVNIPCRNADRNSIGIDTMIGAGIGIAIGNQIGSGSGRDAAKIVGGLLGANIANNDRRGSCKSYETIERVEPIYEYTTIHKTIGWNNCAYIEGTKYCKQTANKIEFLKVRRTVTVY